MYFLWQIVKCYVQNESQSAKLNLTILLSDNIIHGEVGVSAGICGGAQ